MSMLELSRASLVLALSRDGDLTIVKNARGPRLREEGLQALAEQLLPADLDLLVELLMQKRHGNSISNRARVSLSRAGTNFENK